MRKRQPLALSRACHNWASLDGGRMGSHCRAWVLTTALAGIATLAGLSAQAVDAWAGTWKLNLAKSRYALGPAPRSAVSRLEPSEDAWKVSQDTIRSEERRVGEEGRSR